MIFYERIKMMMMMMMMKNVYRLFRGKPLSRDF